MDFYYLLGLIIAGSLIPLISVIWIVWKWREIKNWFYMRLPMYRDRYHKVYFIAPNGQIRWQPLVLNVDNQFDYEGGRYDYKEDCLKFEKRTPVMYYFLNRPEPINFLNREVENSIELDGSTYKAVMKAKLIRDLVSEQRQFMIIIMILAGIGVAVVVLILFEMGFLEDIAPKK